MAKKLIIPIVLVAVVLAFVAYKATRSAPGSSDGEAEADPHHDSHDHAEENSPRPSGDRGDRPTLPGITDTASAPDLPPGVPPPAALPPGVTGVGADPARSGKVVTEERPPELTAEQEAAAAVHMAEVMTARIEQMEQQVLDLEERGKHDEAKKKRIAIKRLEERAEELKESYSPE